MATTTKRRTAAATTAADVRVAKIAWLSAGAGAALYALAIDARATTWPLVEAIVSGISAGVAGVL